MGKIVLFSIGVVGTVVAAVYGAPMWLVALSAVLDAILFIQVVRAH